MTVRSWRLFILGLKKVLYLKYHSWLSVFFGGRGKRGARAPRGFENTSLRGRFSMAQRYFAAPGAPQAC